MEVLGIILGIVGVLLTVVLSTPIWRGIMSTIESMRRKQWSGEQYRKGVLQNKTHIAFDDWSSLFYIDSDGNCTQTYVVRVVNTSSKLLKQYHLPVFCDAKPLSVVEVDPWGKERGKEMVVDVDDWDEQAAQGRFKILFNRPLEPGERRRFSYGLKLPGLFAAGDDYYNWDVEVPYYDLKGEIKFSSGWKVRYAKWNVANDKFVSDPVFDDRSIKWQVMFPPVQTRLHMEFGLEKR